MTKVIVDQTFWELFPEAELEILAVEELIIIPGKINCQNIKHS